MLVRATPSNGRALFALGAIKNGEEVIMRYAETWW